MPDPAADTRPFEPERPDAAIVPDWLANLASLSWRVVAVVGLVIVSWGLATLLWTVTASIAVAVVVSALFAPWVMRLRARGRSRTIAAAIVWATALLVVVGIGILLLLLFLPQLVTIVQQLDAAVTAVKDEVAKLGLPPELGQLLEDLIAIVRNSAGATTGGGLVSWAAGAVTVMVLATFLVFFFLRDGDLAWIWAFQAVEETKRDRITDAGEDALARLGGYLRGTTILSAIIAGTDLVFMVLLGVPSAVPLAILVFLGGYIPYFGGLVTTGIILLVTWATLGTFPVVVLLVLIAIRNVFLGYGLRPTLYGRTVSIHPALVLLVLPAGFQLAGVVGLFAAVPVTAVIFAVFRATLAILEPDPPPVLPGLVPAWLDRVAQWSWRILAAIALVAILVAVFIAIPLVLLPIVVALILAATLEPLVRWLQRRGWSRARASAASVGGGLLAVVGIILIAVASLATQVAQLGATTISGADAVNAASGGNAGLLAGSVAFGAATAVQTVRTLIESVASIGVITVLSALLSFYLLRDGSGLWVRALTHARPGSLEAVDRAGRRAFEVLGGYMSGTAAISFVGAFSQLVIMLVLGIDFALPVFVLSFFLCFIPYIGGFISTGIALLLTIAMGTPADIAIMVVWTVVFNIVTGNIVSPIVYGKTVHLHPAVVLVGIPAGSAVAGVLGMFMVVPVLGVVASTWRTVLAVMGSDGGAVGDVGADGMSGLAVPAADTPAVLPPDEPPEAAPAPAPAS